MSRSTLPLLTSANPAAWLGLSLETCDALERPSGATTATPDSDRLALIASQLQAVVGSQALALRWLRRRNASLGDKPINLLKSPDGQLRVLQHLERFAGN